MKKLLLTLALAVGAINSGFAADLYVNNSGQSGTYTTIQAAINAASTGDNIYVSPLNSYQESLSVTKSIRIASSVAGSRIIVTQDIKISPLANILVELIGVEGTNVTLDTQTSTLGPNSRGKIVVSDCAFTNINIDTDYMTIILVKNNLTGSVTIRHGKIIGNIVTGSVTINDEPNIGIGDTVTIKANHVKNGIVSNTDDHSLIIQNNKTRFIDINNWRSGILTNGLIANNSILPGDKNNLLSYSAYRIDIAVTGSNQDVSNMIIVNNALITPSFSFVNNSSSFHYIYYRFIGISSSVAIPPKIEYNLDYRGAAIITGSYASRVYIFRGSSNSGIYLIQKGGHSFTYPIAESDIELITKTTFKDLGSPSTDFYDSDLTRSDFGHLGGDNSWEMFHGTNSVTGAAYIIGLDLPSEIWPGQTVNLKAEAVHTN